jgi:CHAD domain-containing protein/uncharacterized protein YjbK
LRHLGRFKFEPAGSQTVVDRYLDTADRRLFRAGFACRLRSADIKQVLTLKSLTPASGNIHRRQQVEETVDLEQPLGDQPEDWPKSEVKNLVLAQVQQNLLQTLFTIYQTRHILRVYLGQKPVIEFSLDAVSLQDPDTPEFLELEAELLEEGTEADLALFLNTLHSYWPLPPETQSKFELAWIQTKQSQDPEEMSYSLTDNEKYVLEQIAGGPEETQARRAKIILLGHEGLLLPEIAEKAACSGRTVRRWQGLFRKKRLAIFREHVQPVSAQPSPVPNGNEDMESLPPEPPASKKTAPAPEAEDPAPAGKTVVELPARPDGPKAKEAALDGIGLEPTDSLAEAGRKVLRFYFAQMLEHEPGTRAGEDIEALHDMRVASRRMRAGLRVFGPAFTRKSLKRLRAGLKATGQALGPVRDLDVFMAKLQEYQQSLPEQEQPGLTILLDAWQAQRDKARQDMLAYLDGKAYADFKQFMLEFVGTKKMGARPIPSGLPIPYQLRHVVPGLVYDRYEAVHAYEVVLDNASLETLHQLRITFKELRYILEYFREILGEEREAVINQVKTIQDHLGDLNDAHVASAILRDFLAGWEQSQLHLPLRKRQNPAQVATYLNAKLNEQHQLLITFPKAWARFNSPKFRRNLALAISVL